MKARQIISIALSVLALVSCKDRFEEGDRPTGKDIVFTVASEEVVAESKSEYSFTGTEKAKDYVTINWQKGDVVRIYCDQAIEPVSQEGRSFADYWVTDDGKDTPVACIEGFGGLGLRWGTVFPHYFYAMSPGPSTVESPSVAIDVIGKDISAKLPSEQNTMEGALSSTTDGTTGKTNWTLAPDMKWQLLGSKAEYKKMELPIQGVFMQFRPFCTAIQFTIQNGTGKPLNLYKVEVYSEASKISGDFTVDLDKAFAGESGAVTTTDATAADKIATLTLNNTDDVSKDVTLEAITGDDKNTGGKFTFTFFLAPTQDVNDLTFKLYKHQESEDVDGEGTGEYENVWMSTKLAYNDGPRTGVTFPASKFAFVKGLLVPDSAVWQVKYSPDVDAWKNQSEGGIDVSPELDPQVFVTSWKNGSVENQNMTKFYYVFDITCNTLFPYTGSVGDIISITSYKEANHSAKDPVLWHIEYFDEKNGQWIVPDQEMPTPPIDDIVTFSKVSGTPPKDNVCKETITMDIKAAKEPTNSYTHSEVLYNAQAKGSSNPYDLSMHDIFGNERPGLDSEDARPVTANCYVINSPGVYAFPLVYGNGIDYTWAPAGGENTNAFNPGSETPNTRYRMSRFINCKGEGIRSPFIETDLQSAVNNNWKVNVKWYGSTTAAFTTTDCQLLSRAAAEGLHLTACNCGYVMFNINKEKIKQGNALITVSDGSKIVWSWHIWITDNDLAPTQVTTTPTGQIMDMMPINLGWVDSDDNAHKYYEGKSLRIKFVQDGSKAEKEFILTRKADSDCKHLDGTSTYYQWGRKDPFGTSVNPQSYSTSRTVGYSVQHPQDFITGDRWYYATDEKDEHGIDIISTYLNLWSSLNRQAPANLSEKPLKTIYDPCPPGFQVPQGNAFSHFSTSVGEWEDGKGYYFTTGLDTIPETIFINASGYIDRNTTTGTPTGTGKGYYWTAAPFEAGSSYRMLIQSDNVETGSNNWTNGMSIRPVQE